MKNTIAPVYPLADSDYFFCEIVTLVIMQSVTLTLTLTLFLFLTLSCLKAYIFIMCCCKSSQYLTLAVIYMHTTSDAIKKKKIM